MEYDELYHYGILGMKWGIRRYQNEDGTWTAAGKKRYGEDTNIGDKKRIKRAKDAAQVKEKIEKLQNKKHISSKRSSKIERLSAIHSGLVKDLDSREVEYGERLVKKQHYLSRRMRSLKIAGISKDGRRAIYALRAANYSMSEEGKKTKALKKELKSLNKASKSGK